MVSAISSAVTSCLSVIEHWIATLESSSNSSAGS
eukprot:02191.XXX_1887_1988_1 [CDS] Oithona nana genome sequencing.